MNLTQDFISKVKNILVVGKNNQVGDMICSLPLYAALKKKFPEAKITLVAAKTNYPVPLKEINPFLDRVIVYDKSSLKTIFNFYRQLRKIKYQIGIVTSTFAYSTTSHIINYLSGAKIRVGVNSIDEKINRGAKFLNIKKDFFWDKEKKHQSERNLDVIRQIGCDLTPEEIEQTGIILSESDEQEASNFINRHFTDKSKKIIAVHPGAGKTHNLWNVENFFELLSQLYNKYENYVLITCGPMDKDVVNTLTTKLLENNIEYVIENLPQKQLCAVLKKIDLYITNDTGTMHLAASSGTKLIGLFGPTNTYEWAPRGKNQNYIQAESGKINDISVDEVFKLSEKILEK
ncbi:MAG: glycosyltransferase family 9 protein [Ignavibacteriaceae bacterium]